MIAPTETRAERARAAFVDRCFAVAEQSGCSRLSALVDAANALGVNPRQPWLTLHAELNAWQRVYAIKGPADAAAWYDRLAEALGSDARWEVPRA